MDTAVARSKVTFVDAIKIT